MHKRLTLSRKSLGICVLLVLATLLVFGQTLRFEFLNFDDDSYVTENPAITSGLTLRTIGRAFTDTHMEWTPLVTISHMIDFQLYGLNSAGFHATNLLLHLASVILLFLVVREMTGDQWRSAFVAALFAIHPLRAESVAWVTERKDLLSGLFFMLSLGAYVGYVRAPSIPRYLLLLVAFALGLFSKAMLVTLPFVLLLLDYWPLNRLFIESPVSKGGQRRLWGRLVWEKLPLFLLAAASCPLAMSSAKCIIESRPLEVRISAAFIAYAVYLRDFFWPADLAPWHFYPLAGWAGWEMAAAVLLFISITVGVLLGGKRHRYLVTGWFWYIGMLVPVIGLVPVGIQARADRFTYLPQIGIALLVTWAAFDLARHWPDCRRLFAAFGVLIIGTLMAAAHAQTSYWRDSETLWKREVACIEPHAVVLNNYGSALRAKGRLDDSIVQFRSALVIDPSLESARLNLGSVLLAQGRLNDAVTEFKTALSYGPSADGETNLGLAFKKLGRSDEAVDHYRRALAIDPNKETSLVNLGNALLDRDEWEEAVRILQHATTVGHSEVAHYNLGNAFLRAGRLDESLVEFRTAIDLEPANPDAHNNLGLVLIQKLRFNEGIHHFRVALQLRPDFPLAQKNLNWAETHLPVGANGQARRIPAHPE